MNACHGRGWTALLASLCLATLAAGSAEAARTREFRMSGPDEVQAGELEGTSMTAEGMILPAPASRQLMTGEAAFVWSLSPDGQGGVYAGTGSQGKVYRIAADGSWTVVAETLEYELFALAQGPRGLCFAGAPNGTVLRLGADKTVETLVDLPQLVWSLIPGEGGVMFAGSGESGEIHRISADGAASVLAKVPDTHVVSLAWWRGRLVCGTDGRGLLVEVDPDGGATRVLYDADEEEVVSLLPLGDRLLFAANGAGLDVTTSGEMLVLPVIEVKPDGTPQGAVLYEMKADGLVRAVWETSEKRILSLALAPDGRVLAGTGDEGVLFALDSLWNAVRLIDVPEADLLSLAVSGDRVFMGTGNGGSLYRLDWNATGKGEYVSQVWDAGQVSSWGSPDWVTKVPGQVVFESRSGQTSAPDETWSSWQGLSEGRIASPPGRFLQWRMALAAEGGRVPEVGSVVVPYRGPNRAPEILSLDVSAQSAAAGESGSPPETLHQDMPGGVKVEYEMSEPEVAASTDRPRPGLWARTLRSAAWKARDPDGDRLRYDVYLRFESDEEFHLLKRDLETPAWTWEAAAWPDGWYQLKVVARDERDNSPRAGLVATRVSQPFRIDNTPPLLESLAAAPDGQGWRVSGRARDAASRIATIEYSVDGEGWRDALSSDGIIDGTTEDFSIPIETQDGRRPAVVGVRVSDEAGHLATGRVRLTPASPAR